MKRIASVSIVVMFSALSAGAAGAQMSGSKGSDMKGMDMKGMDMKGMDMKEMDMSKCREMHGMGKDMHGMMEKCMQMMGKNEASADAKVGAKTHTASGLVKSVDRASGKVTIAHGPIASLDWPSMTMAFGVKDKKMLDALAVGKKVDFELARQGSDYVITEVR